MSGSLRHARSDSTLVSLPQRYRLERRGSTSGTMNAVKMVVLGASGVGKSALTVRYLTRRFIGEYHPTLENTYRSKTTIDDEEFSMEILDTAGLENNIFRDGHTSWGEAFMFVYSITDRSSFEQVKQIWTDLKSQKSPQIVAALLVGNKNDLKHYRQVPTNDGDKLAEFMGCQFYEVSALDGQQIPLVAELFRNLVRELRNKKLETARKGSSTSAQMRRAVKEFLSFRSSKTRLNSNNS
ncbi:ras-related and estrogen-regulated growth inhibitor-like [Saccoglossus kowalevskii]